LFTDGWCGENGHMTITFPDGTRMQAAQLTRSADTLRVAVRGEDDARGFIRISGAWISEEIDSVRIEFEWDKRRNTIPSQDDCICDKRLAGRLIARLLNPEGDEAMSLSRV